MTADTVTVIGIVAALLAAESLLLRGDVIPLRRAIAWNFVWLAVGVVPAVVIALADDGGQPMTYLTVYLIERVLTLDNLVVFLLIFSWFAVPAAATRRLLLVGIALALAMRGVAIVAGLAMLDRFHFVVYVLGVLLLALAVRMWGGSTENHDPEANPAVKAVRKLVPIGGYEGSRIVTRSAGRLMGTPLLPALVAILAADIAFAVDSIPAAIAITDDPLIIWAANGFALLGMRPLFVVVADLVDRFHYLTRTVALILGLVAMKMLISDLWKVPPTVSLAAVLALFAAGIVLSIMSDRRTGGPDRDDPTDVRPIASESEVDALGQ